MPRRGPELEFHLRLRRGGRRIFGPGKARLLENVAATGSIAAAARRMKMSYARAWTLARDMNRLFTEPLLSVTRGGGKGGGAALTPTGRKVLKIFLQMESRAARAVVPAWSALRRLLRT